MTVSGGTYNCGEFCPDNDVTGSIGRGTKMLRRGLDSLCLATLLTHDRYIGSITGSADPLNTTSNNWRTILRGITNNLSSYNPIYVTLDYGCQYARALKTSRVLRTDYNTVSGEILSFISGRADLDTSLQIYFGTDNLIGTFSGNIPAFTNSDVMKLVAATLPVAPTILQQPVSRTNHLGTPATFTIAAVGTAPNFQWHKEGTPIASATASTLLLPSVTAADAGAYRAIASNAYGAATSSVAQLVVRDPLTIQSITATNDGALLTWPAIPGLSYGVQYKDSLADPDWQLLGPVSLAQSTNGAATNAMQPTAERFVRLFVVP